MGFWHTGYMEFHEETGLEGILIEYHPPTFPCDWCSEVYSTLQDLRDHRFSAHPLQRPTLFLDGREIGSRAARVTRPLISSDVVIDNCDKAILNGVEIPVEKLANQLSEFSRDTQRISLMKDGIEAECVLEYAIASDKDLAGVESEFLRISKGRRLNTRVVEDFISSTESYSSAIVYCDGICSYLYGVLARERASDSSIPYDAYIQKFSKSSEDLTGYDRPLARTIVGLVQFHFNHFSEAARLGSGMRIGAVAKRYVDWIRYADSRQSNPIEANNKHSLEDLVIDWESEQIIRWGIRESSDLRTVVDEIEEFSLRELAEYDRVKISILLAEVYADIPNATLAIKYAKSLRNIPAFEAWAESLIRQMSEVN